MSKGILFWFVNMLTAVMFMVVFTLSYSNQQAIAMQYLFVGNLALSSLFAVFVDLVIVVATIFKLWCAANDVSYRFKMPVIGWGGNWETMPIYGYTVVSWILNVSHVPNHNPLGVLMATAIVVTIFILVEFNYAVWHHSVRQLKVSQRVILPVTGELVSNDVVPSHPEVTSRQFAIMEKRRQQVTIKEIASDLKISTSTVKNELKELKALGMLS